MNERNNPACFVASWIYYLKDFDSLAPRSALEWCICSAVFSVCFELEFEKCLFVERGSSVSMGFAMLLLGRRV